MKTPFVFFAVNRCWRLLALLATLAALLLAPLAASAQANVEPYTGTSTYTIPIVTPPGTNGMGPNLALTYGSGSGDGWFGHNWGLSGLGYVERRGPQYGLAPDYNDATDTFLLNWGGVAESWSTRESTPVRARRESSTARRLIVT